MLSSQILFITRWLFIPHQPSILTYPSPNPHFPTLTLTFPHPILNPHPTLTYPSHIPHPTVTYPSRSVDCVIITRLPIYYHGRGRRNLCIGCQAVHDTHPLKSQILFAKRFWKSSPNCCFFEKVTNLKIKKSENIRLFLDIFLLRNFKFRYQSQNETQSVTLKKNSQK